MRPKTVVTLNSSREPDGRIAIFQFTGELPDENLGNDTLAVRKWTKNKVILSLAELQDISNLWSAAELMEAHPHPQQGM